MGWVANLDNGETIKEGQPEPGKVSPWQGLLQYCKRNNVKISRLRLTAGDHYVEAMPRKMCDGYFQAYEASKVLFRETAMLKQGIGSIIGDTVFITWVDLSPSPDMRDNGMYMTHQDVRPLSEVKIHTTLY